MKFSLLVVFILLGAEMAMAKTHVCPWSEVKEAVQSYVTNYSENLGQRVPFEPVLVGKNKLDSEGPHSPFLYLPLKNHMHLERNFEFTVYFSSREFDYGPVEISKELLECLDQLDFDQYAELGIEKMLVQIQVQKHAILSELNSRTIYYFKALGLSTAHHLRHFQMNFPGDKKQKDLSILLRRPEADNSVSYYRYYFISESGEPSE